jgi:SHS2 domain-containing protein
MLRIGILYQHLMDYKYLPHTADQKFQAFGKTLEEAFSNAAYAMINILTDTKKVKHIERKKIRIRAKKIESLLYDFLEEFLFNLDTKGLILSKIEDIKIEKNDDYELSCEYSGDNYKKYDIKGDIKSITYNGMFVKEEKGKFVIQAVVDI